MTDLKVVTDRFEAKADDRGDVITILREALDHVESGEFAATEVVVILVDTHSVETFSHRVTWHGRASSVLGWLDVARNTIFGVMGIR